MVKLSYCVEILYGRVDLVINCGFVSKFWGWDSDYLEKVGGVWWGGVRIVYSLVFIGNDFLFRILFSFCFFVGWLFRDVEVVVRGMVGLCFEFFGVEGFIGLL